jgi:transcriptional antiterminator NusG
LTKDEQKKAEAAEESGEGTEAGPEAAGEAAAEMKEADFAGEAVESASGETKAAGSEAETAEADETAEALKGEEAADDPKAKKKSLKHWYVVHTFSGHENKVKLNLEKAISQSPYGDRFGRVLVATEDFAEMKAGKRTVSRRKTFPSYVLVEVEFSNDTRHLVMNIPGVTRFVGSGKTPAPLQKSEVKRILGQMDGSKAKPIAQVPFKTGEHVKVVDGPFNDFSGVVEEVNAERGKLKVMVSIFGRPTPVELDFLQVKAI